MDVFGSKAPLYGGKSSGTCRIPSGCTNPPKRRGVQKQSSTASAAVVFRVPTLVLLRP